MKKIIILNSEKIEYTLKVSERARGIRLAVYHDGNFVVTVPKRVREGVAEEFIIQKSEWILSKLEHFKKSPKREILKHTTKEIKEYKVLASEHVRNRLEHWNRFYNFNYNKITIKKVKSRWGSCSRNGNLNFNYKIALLPQELADYIVVHELCHLSEMNHSSKFWNLVAVTLPHHKELRRQLKQLH